MNWEEFYFICFAVGLLLSVISFASGYGHFPIGHFHAHAGHGARGTGMVSPFNLFSAMAFLCWFGGAGYLLSHFRFAAVPVVFLLAAITGLAGAAVIFWFLAKVLLPRERTLLPEDTDMCGVIGEVSSRLRRDGVGEILYSLNGTRRSAAARAEGGVAIERGTQVLVMRYEMGVAWVRRFDDLDELVEPEPPT